VRWVAWVAIGMLLGACARDPYVSTTANTLSSGNWKIERQTDRITGTAISSALLMTRNAAHSGVNFAQPAGLQLTCFEGHPIVRISFDHKIGSDKNSSVGYRFDEKPGHDHVASRILVGYQIIVIEDKAAVGRFVDDLAGSTTLYLRIRSLNAGRTTAEFRLDGAEAAVQAAFADCPVGAPSSSQKRAA
jgi:hypothetical protein